MDAERQQRAAQYVAQQLSRQRRDKTWLVVEADLDPGTVTDFLAGTRWPREATRSAIEDALRLERGRIEAVAKGWHAAAEGEGDPVEAAIEASPDLTRAQKLRLRAVYAEMLEGVSGDEQTKTQAS